MRPYVPALLVLGFVLVSSQLFGQNVIIFTIDSCRADRIGVYGRSPSPTPNIDRWAGSGTVFTNAYSTSAWTAPGVVSVLSGLYPPTHGINNRDQTGSTDLPTILKILKKAGYRVPNLTFFSFSPYFRNVGLGPVERHYFTDTRGDELFNWLEHVGKKDEEAPFMLWYHTTLAHQPYRPPQKFLPRPLAEYEQRPALQAAANGAIVPVGSVSFEPQDKPLLDELYDGEMRNVDDLFGRLLETLRALDLYDDTMIILTADHGEELLDHGFVGHASTSLRAKLYEELVRIPLVFGWPGKVPAGRRDGPLASQIDILPTVLALLGRPIPSHVDGVDLFTADRSNRELFFESVIAGNQTTKDNEDVWLRAVRKGRYKFISQGELYDLKNDPKETRNLVERRPELARQLEKELQSWHAAALEKRHRLFQDSSTRYSSARPGHCPEIREPGNGAVLSYQRSTGLVRVRWDGEISARYVIEYDIGTGDHHIAGSFEVDGNLQLFGPFDPELWGNLKAWNPFKFRVSPKTNPPCWSRWRTFKF